MTKSDEEGKRTSPSPSSSFQFHRRRRSGDGMDVFRGSSSRAAAHGPSRSWASVSLGRMEEADALYTGVTQIVLGNMLSLILAVLVYYNYILFSSYIGVMVYAYLLSEAMWDTKVALVNAVEYVNNGKHSPRKWIKSVGAFFVDYFRFVSIAAAVALVACFLAWPFPSLIAFLVVAVVVMIIYALDHRIFWLTQIHRLFVDDHMLVASTLIVVAVIAGTIVVAAFVLLSVKDAMTAFDAVTRWVDAKLIKNGAVYDTWRRTVGINATHSMLQSYVDSFEAQYNETAWAPMVHAVVDYFEAFKENVNSQFSADSRALSNARAIPVSPADAFYGLIPQWLANKTVIEAGMAIFSSAQEMYLSQDEFSDQYEQMLKHARQWAMSTSEGALVITAQIFSVVGSVFDAGIRLMFMVTFLLFLLSSKQNIMHTFLMDFERGGGRGDVQNVLPFEKKLRTTIEGIFLLPIKMSILHALASLCIFFILRVPYMFFASNLSLVFTLFPVVYPYMTIIPWCVVLCLNSDWWTAFVLFLSHYVLFGSIDDWVLRSSFEQRMGKTKHAGERACMTGLSVFFGVAAFGFQGVVLGPLLVSFALVVVEGLIGQVKKSRSGKRARPRSTGVPWDALRTRPRMKPRSKSGGSSPTPPKDRLNPSRTEEFHEAEAAPDSPRAQ